MKFGALRNPDADEHAKHKHCIATEADAEERGVSLEAGGVQLMPVIISAVDPTRTASSETRAMTGATLRQGSKFQVQGSKFRDASR